MSRKLIVRIIGNTGMSVHIADGKWVAHPHASFAVNGGKFNQNGTYGALYEKSAGGAEYITLLDFVLSQVKENVEGAGSHNPDLVEKGRPPAFPAGDIKWKVWQVEE